MRALLGKCLGFLGLAIACAVSTAQDVGVAHIESVTPLHPAVALERRIQSYIDELSISGEQEPGFPAAIYYQEQYWGKGCSRKLMAHALEQLETSGYDVTTIWVLKDNFRAQKFYAKHGFIADGKEKIDQRGPIVLDELRMIRRP